MSKQCSSSHFQFPVNFQNRMKKMKANFLINQVMQCIGHQILHQVQKQLLTGILENSWSENFESVVKYYPKKIADLCSANLLK